MSVSYTHLKHYQEDAEYRQRLAGSFREHTKSGFRYGGTRSGGVQQERSGC